MNMPETIGYFVLTTHSETLRDGRVEVIVRYNTAKGEEARVAFSVIASALKAYRLTIMTKVLDEINRQIDVIEKGRVVKPCGPCPEGG